MTLTDQKLALALLRACQKQIREGESKSNPLTLLVLLTKFFEKVEGKHEPGRN